ncbi:MAG: hypothetical protein V7767_13520, partial [Leeuwenhoekiella sp.]
MNDLKNSAAKIYTNQNSILDNTTKGQKRLIEIADHTEKSSLQQFYEVSVAPLESYDLSIKTSSRIAIIPLYGGVEIGFDSGTHYAMITQVFEFTAG